MIVDAHNHLHDPQFEAILVNLPKELERAGVAHCIVNGTRESDWDKVATLCAQFPAQLSPAFGLHPWYLKERSADWAPNLEHMLDTHPRASIGECGLDKWMKGADLPLQREVLLEHLRIAAARNLAVTIHCLRAWGSLLEILRDTPLPLRGFLLHAYGGPPEMIAELVGLGAYFSFNGSFFSTGKEAKLQTFHEIPTDRLLIETDAPAMLPPACYQVEHGQINHPRNLPLVVEGLATALRIDNEELIALTRRNAQRLWEIN